MTFFDCLPSQIFIESISANMLAQLIRLTGCAAQIAKNRKPTLISIYERREGALIFRNL